MGRGGGSFGVGAILRIWGENVVRGIGKGEGGGGVGGKRRWELTSNRFCGEWRNSNGFETSKLDIRFHFVLHSKHTYTIAETILSFVEILRRLVKGFVMALCYKLHIVFLTQSVHRW